MRLEVLSKKDCETVRGWRNADLSSLRTPYFLTEEMQEDFYQNCISQRDSRHRYWAIRISIDDSEEGEVLIGMGGFTNIEWENSQAEISLVIDSKRRAKGYGKQAVHLLLNHAFNNMHLDLVYGECYLTNERGRLFWQTLVETKYHGEIRWLRKGKYWDGKRHGTMYFDIDKDGFGKV